MEPNAPTTPMLSAAEIAEKRRRLIAEADAAMYQQDRIGTAEFMEEITAIAEAQIKRFQDAPCRGELVGIRDCSDEYMGQCPMFLEPSCPRQIRRFDEARESDKLSDRLAEAGIPRALLVTALSPSPTEAKAKVDDWLPSDRRMLVLAGVPGVGKCLGKGTPVLRFDGRVVPVESVGVGDLLMGPDSRPRTVLSTTSGTGNLFMIVPVKGDPWVCNEHHVLTVVHSNGGQVRDLSIHQLEQLNDRPRWKQFFVGVDFPPAEPLPLDPYFLGAWFGDGSKGTDFRQAHEPLSKVAITKPDPEIRNLAEETARQFGLRVRAEYHNNCFTLHIVGDGSANPLLDLMRSLLGPQQHVPTQYLTASRHDRAAFLAGWLDTDGHLEHGCYDFVQKRKDYAEAVAFLARSLGLRVTVRPKEVPGYGEFWRLTISGDCTEIPLRIPRKKSVARQQIKNVRRTGFRVEPIGQGEYFGFSLDGDSRFLLGDFTVTHNSVAAAYAIRRYRGTWIRASQVGKAQGFDADAKTLLLRLRQTRLLVIDDLGSENNSDFSRAALEDLIGERYDGGVRTILTTNLDGKAFKAAYTARLCDRIAGEGAFQWIGGTSLRGRKP